MSTVITTTSANNEEVVAPSTSSRAAVLPRRIRRTSIGSTIFSKMLYHEDASAPTRSSAAWVIGMAYLEHDAGFEVIRKMVRQLGEKYARFRSVCKLDEKGQGLFEEVHGELDWDYHIPDLSVRTKGWTQEDVYEFLNEVGEYKYDLNKPLWRYLYIPQLADGRALLITCVNHVIGDGLALVAVTEALYDPLPVAPKGESPKNAKHQGKKPVTKQMDLWSKLGVFIYGLYFGLTIPLSRADPPNPLRMPKGQKALNKKRLALAEPISLDRVKEVKNKMEGTTINDVLMAVMTMALKAFFIEEQRYRPGEKVTAQFPISMRGVGEGGLDTTGEPHNKVSYAYFDFNFAGTREEIVWHTKQQIDCIKMSPSPMIINWNLEVGTRLLPHKLLMDITNEAANLGTAQLSNVPAPQAQVTMCNGIKVTDMNFFLFSPLACYLGILTYNGIVNAAFNLDSGLNVDPKRLAKHWNAEFEKLYDEVMAKSAKNGGEPLKEPFHDTTFYQNLAKVTVSCLVALLAYLMLF